VRSPKFDILENPPISIDLATTIRGSRVGHSIFITAPALAPLNIFLILPSSYFTFPTPQASTHNQASISKMERRPSVTQKAASTNKVPTPHTAAPVTRSASYSSPQEDSNGSNSGEKAKEDEGSYSRQLQTASTELLNDERVGLGSKAGRTLQNVLMDTEHRLKKQRRESLHKPGHKLVLPRGIFFGFMSADFDKGP
jgi:hypothetical protein